VLPRRGSGQANTAPGNAGDFDPGFNHAPVAAPPAAPTTASQQRPAAVVAVVEEQAVDEQIVLLAEYAVAQEVLANGCGTSSCDTVLYNRINQYRLDTVAAFEDAGGCDRFLQNYGEARVGGINCSTPATAMEALTVYATAAGMLPFVGEFVDGAWCGGEVIALAIGRNSVGSASFSCGALAMPLVPAAGRRAVNAVTDAAKRAPSGAHMDSFLANGSTVNHSGSATAIGDDAATLVNFGRSQGAAGHDVIVHGQVIDGEAFFVTNGLPTHPQQIADVVLSNPGYVPGSPVQLVTCYGACGLADELSVALGGVPVSASPYRVQIDPVTGLLLEAKP